MCKTIAHLFSLILLFTATYAQQTIIDSFNFEGRTREYAIYVPAAFDSTKATPLVLVLHHNGATGPAIIDYMGFDVIADTAGFLSVYPTALEDQFASDHAWNAGINPLNQINDVGFLSALIDTMMSRYWIDTARVYAAGHSMGGFMCYRLGCELTNRIAAIAASGGTMALLTYSLCNPSRPLPVLHKHGTNDAHVLWDGSEPPLITSVDVTVNYWVQHDHCPETPVVTQLPDVVNDGYYYETYDYGPCDDGTEVILYKAVGAPHGWQAFGHDITVPEEVWKFFKKFDINGRVEAPEDTSVQTAIDHTLENSPINVQPNPFHDNLAFTLPSHQSGQLNIYDLFGHLVSSTKVDSGKSKRLYLKTSNWTDGVYLLAFESSKGVVRRKLVRQ